MLKTSLCDYSYAYILASGTIAINWAGEEDAAKGLDQRDKGVILKNCGPFTDCISEINYTQIDNIKCLDAVMLMHNIIKYSDNYLKTLGNLL